MPPAIYADGWIAGTASANLQQPGGDQAASIRGTIPKIGDPAFKTDVTLLVDDREVGAGRLAWATFSLRARKESAGKTAGNRGLQRIAATASGDGRTVAHNSNSWALSLRKSGPAARSILSRPESSTGERLGADRDLHREHFRWVENDAQILITPQRPAIWRFSMEVEAGPGVAAVSPEGSRRLRTAVAAVLVEGRKAVKLFIPVETGKPNEFKLHVDGGGRRIQNDPRILNSAYFKLQPNPGRP